MDQHVSAQPAQDFLGHLQNTEGQFEYREYPESDHFMRPQDWEDGWSRTLTWFDNLL